MEPIFQKDFTVTEMCVDCFGRLKPSVLLMFAQEVAGMHCLQLSVDYDTLAQKRMFWAVTRHKVEVTRMPLLGETIRVETWPMPTTRVAYPRATVAYDAQGKECFRCISLWVLMDLDTRSMILPGKSGISVIGTLRGNELPSPTGLIARSAGDIMDRRVLYTDLDRNGHMNNTRYLDWIEDLLPSRFHAGQTLREITICYIAEAREGQTLTLRRGFTEDGCLQVDAFRQEEDHTQRVFTAKLLYH